MATPITTNRRYAHDPYSRGTPLGQMVPGGLIVTPSPHSYNMHATPLGVNSVPRGVGTPNFTGLDTDLGAELLGPIADSVQRAACDSPLEYQRPVPSTPPAKAWRGVYLTPQGTPKHQHHYQNQFTGPATIKAQHNSTRSAHPSQPMLRLGGEGPQLTNAITIGNHYAAATTRHSMQQDVPPSYESVVQTSSFRRPPPMQTNGNSLHKVRPNEHEPSAAKRRPVQIGTPSQQRGKAPSQRVSPLHFEEHFGRSPTKASDILTDIPHGRVSSGSSGALPPAPLGESTGESSTPYPHSASLPREGSADLLALANNEGSFIADFSATNATATTPTELASTHPSLVCFAKRVSQRQKQIEIGKSTLGYKNYEAAVSKSDREEGNVLHPVTPTTDGRTAKRNFDRSVREWRKALHAWDEPLTHELAAFEAGNESEGSGAVSLQVGYGSHDES